MSERGSVLTRVRRPEYTGENRCVPCTILNVTIGGVGALALVFVWLGAGGSAGVAAIGGLSAFALSLVAIYLRGYLIPGTPAITRRYFPERLLELFGKGRDPRPAIESIDGDDLVSLLSEADVVAEEGGSATLTEGFRTCVRDRIEAGGSDSDAEPEPGPEPESKPRPDPDGLRSLLDADAVSALGPTSFEVDDEGIERWVSTEAVATDVAMAAELESRIGGWTDLDREERRDVLTGLRLQMAGCPACGSRTETTVERLEHCCRKTHVGARTDCPECGTIIADHVVPESAADTWIGLLDGDLASGQ